MTWSLSGARAPGTPSTTFPPRIMAERTTKFEELSRGERCAWRSPAPSSRAPTWWCWTSPRLARRDETRQVLSFLAASNAT